MSGPVRIVRIAAGGDGVGRLADGRTVFVPRTAPGDLVELAEVTLHARFARARLGRLVEASPERVVARCGHYRADLCGGCQLQHLAAPAQQAARRAIVGEALRRLARLEVPDPELDTTGSAWHYRTRVTLAVAPLTRAAGFHRLGQPDAVFPLDRCEIADERLNAVWQQVRAAAPEWPPALEQIVLRLGRDGSTHAGFRGPARPGEPLVRALAAAGAGAPAVWWLPPRGRPRRAGAGPAAGGAMPPGVFEQVHPEMGNRVRAHALAELGEVRGRHVWDLYAGIGETAAALVEAGATVESVERDPDAVASALRPAEVERHTGRVEDWIGRLRPAHAAVVNPPRRGLDAAAVRGLLAARPRRLVYISCDPATLARDLTRLAPAYRLSALRAFDLFPQTAHVETVARLELG